MKYSILSFLSSLIIFSSISPFVSADFRLRMYWEDGYEWQESKKEKKWCVTCHDCNHGKRVRIEKCSSTSRQKWKKYKDRNDMIQSDRNNDHKLCLKRDGNKIELDKCDKDDKKQRFDIDGGSSKFQIHPYGKEDDCVTQHHHPKHGEELKTESCKTAEKHDTSYWRKD